jgi:chemotaxis family two-component system response regulator Rcp1
MEIDVCTEDGYTETIRSTSPSPTAPAPEVLLVEDNAGDTLLVGQALAEREIPVHLHIARDGEQALQILKESDFHPDLIILDLSIPKMSGYAVLALYPHKKKIPVVVFSASENEEDVNRSFSLGAREFIHKPMDLEEYKSVVRGMVQKWVPREQTGGQFR